MVPRQRKVKGRCAKHYLRACKPCADAEYEKKKAGQRKCWKTFEAKEQAKMKYLRREVEIMRARVR